MSNIIRFKHKNSANAANRINNHLSSILYSAAAIATIAAENNTPIEDWYVNILIQLGRATDGTPNQLMNALKTLTERGGINDTDDAEPIIIEDEDSDTITIIS